MDAYLLLQHVYKEKSLPLNLSQETNPLTPIMIFFITKILLTINFLSYPIL